MPRPGQQETTIRLLGVGFLGILSDDDPSVEHGRRIVLEDALVELAAVAVGLGVVEHGVVVDVLPIAGQDQAIEPAVGPLSVQHRDGVLAHEPAAQMDVVHRAPAVARLPAVLGRNVVRARALGLDSVVLDPRIVSVTGPMAPPRMKGTITMP